jgi:hypothetical protein
MKLYELLLVAAPGDWPRPLEDRLRGALLVLREGYGLRCICIKEVSISRPCGSGITRCGPRQTGLHLLSPGLPLDFLVKNGGDEHRRNDK